jgi:hypothetical protein
VEAGVVAGVDGGEGLLLLLVAELEGAAGDGEIVEVGDGGLVALEQKKHLCTNV